MQILDRYITRSIIITFFTTILVFSCMYVLIDAASNLDEIIRAKVPTRIMVQYYLSFIPIIIVQTASIACLIATLLTFGTLNLHNEIIALRSCGMSFWRIAKPALYFGLLVSVVIFWVNEQFVPQATAISTQIRNENIVVEADTNKKKKEKIKNLTFYGLKNRLYFIDSFDPNNFELEGITVIGRDNNQNIKEKIVAFKGQWTGIAWKFLNAHVTTFETADVGAPGEIKYYEQKLMDIKENPQDFMRQRLDVNSMNIRQLYEYITRFSSSGAVKALNSLRVDLHQKIAFPVGNIVILLVGLPLAMMTGRRKAFTFTALGIGIVVGFLFQVLNAVGLALGKGGWLPPILSAWLTPIIFLGVALYIIKTKF
ncbi:MAG TPA: LptF/LptG family permease [Candidatus Omnitrophota bacterium]|nr:LptF/LptG family permease [Candidatus Omnitrophota bacterium]HPD84801.1 LptF/LptG family permease [Candidatus Omnitrophota bacterium]HRZ03659.1 LptF/LptG family permease [Candidatus Omnitrophota bacterium]